MIRYKTYAERDVPKQRTPLKVLDTNPVVPETPVDLEPSAATVNQDERRLTDGLAPTVEPLPLGSPYKARKPPKRNLRVTDGSGVENTMPFLTGLEPDTAVSKKPA